MSQPTEKRLNKFISETGYCSRREADKLIEQGRVTLNGLQPEVGSKVTEQDEVCIDGKPLRSKERPIYIALNKPLALLVRRNVMFREISLISLVTTNVFSQ